MKNMNLMNETEDAQPGTKADTQGCLNYPIPLKNAIGYSSREDDLDVLPGFNNPPGGYGEIPFYWWVGDKLDKERLVWQLDKLKEKGITGLQINYPHYASRGWQTNPGVPLVFSDEWWELFCWYVDEVKKRNMAVGVSDYTIHWENSPYYMDEVVKIPGVQGKKLNYNKKFLTTGEIYNASKAQNFITVIAYQIHNGQIDSETGIDLKQFICGNKFNWTVPKGDWVVVEIYGTLTQLDPMNPIVGQAIVNHFLKPFEDKNPGESGKALNYFFQDEERMRGEEWVPWNDNFVDEFKSRKGYDITSYLPALFEDIGALTPKIRLDYHDVKAELIGNGYFKPIFDWNWNHGMTFGSDNNGRGRTPDCYGDYFRTQRFITAPGNDTPGRNSDIIKVKVNSSIAHLYQRPRVWLEGYHSSGWGTTLESITIPTSENFVFGANLLSLHGLYYTTHGGWWEWAPPDFHFRMPYWEHEGIWLKYYERLSYLMSQGYHRCDVAIIYPVSVLEAKGKEANAGQKAVDVAFGLGQKIVQNGIDFDFIDFESVNNSKIDDGQLNIAGEQYRVLVLPVMSAIRSKTMEKALEHYHAGGVVVAIAALPIESDRVGRNDEKLEAMVKEIFGKNAAQVKKSDEIIKNENTNGGVGIYTPNYDNLSKIITDVIERDFMPLNGQDSSEPGKGYVNHRKIGNRDVYMVRNVPKHSECFFRAKGKVELWNSWDGTTKSIFTFKSVEQGTIVRMPLESYQDNIIVFTPGEQGNHVEATNMDTIESMASNRNDRITGYATTKGEKYANVNIGNKTTVFGWESRGFSEGKRATVFKGTAKAPQKITVDGRWDFELKPTLDNQWGDFRLPATKEFIGAEARFFSYMAENKVNEEWYTKDYDDSSWERVTYSKGPHFWQFTPKSGYDKEVFVNKLKDMKVINTTVNTGENNVIATEYSYSIRWGITDSSISEQNWHHGLNCVVPNEFLTLPPKQDTYYWTTIDVPTNTPGKILTSNIKPKAIWVNGNTVPVNNDSLQLKQGKNTVLLQYSNNDNDTQRAYFIIEDDKDNSNFEKYPLAMDWFNKSGVYKFDPYPQLESPVGLYRFTSPLGLRSMKITAYGSINVWVNSEKATVSKIGKTVYGANRYNVTTESSPQAVKVAIRIEQKRGYYKGAAIPEPIKLECISGKVALGDWSKMGVLENYSGGAWYKKQILISQKDCGDKIILNLGSVAATAEVWVNGREAGILVCPPWRLDISEFAKPGKNDIEILVYNTLSNHYSTIPSRYSNFPEDAISGLIGPVSIDIIPQVTLKAVCEGE